MAGRGRGRASTLPAWMTKQGDAAPAPPPARPEQFEDAAEPAWAGAAGARRGASPPRRADRPRSRSRDRGFPGGNGDGYAREPHWADRRPDFRRSRSRSRERAPRGAPPPWEQPNGRGYGGGYDGGYGGGGGGGGGGGYDRGGPPPPRRSRSRSRERRPQHFDYMHSGGRGREDYYNDGRDHRGGWDRGGGGYDHREDRYARDNGDRGYGGGGGGRRDDYNRNGGYRDDPYHSNNGGGAYQSAPADTDASTRRSGFLSGRRFNDFVRDAAKTAAAEYRSGGTEDGEVSGDERAEGEPTEQK